MKRTIVGIILIFGSIAAWHYWELPAAFAILLGFFGFVYIADDIARNYAESKRKQ